MGKYNLTWIFVQMLLQQKQWNHLGLHWKQPRHVSHASTDRLSMLLSSSLSLWRESTWDYQFQQGDSNWDSWVILYSPFVFGPIACNETEYNDRNTKQGDMLTSQPLENNKWHRKQQRLQYLLQRHAPSDQLLWSLGQMSERFCHLSIAPRTKSLTYGTFWGKHSRSKL